MNVLVLLILVGLVASDTRLAEPGPNMTPDEEFLNAICTLKSTKLEVIWDCIKAIPGPLIDMAFKCFDHNTQITGADKFRQSLDELCRVKPKVDKVYDCMLKETESNATLTRLESEYEYEIENGVECLMHVLIETIDANKDTEE